MLSLRQLRYLVALSECLHFRKAAERCHVSQPALTTQIQGLEEALGVQLVERTRRRVIMTSVGVDVAERAREVLRGVDDITAYAKRQGGPLSGSVRLGVIPTVGPYVLPRLLPRVRQLFPQLKLYLREEKTPDLVRNLRLGRIDVALLALPVEGRDVESVHLFDDPFVLAVPTTHKLASGPTVTPPQLGEETVLLLDDGHCLRDQALAICGSSPGLEEADVRATSLNTLVQMVANNLGMTLLPAMSVPVEVPASAGIVVRNFADPAPVRKIGLLWRRSSASKSDFHEFGRMITESLAQDNPDQNQLTPADGSFDA